MQNKSFFSKYFNSSEEVVSMLLGLVIVLVMVGMVMNYFQKRRGTVGLAGITDNKNASEETPTPTGIGGGEYKVKRGDNLWKIAVANYGDGYKWTKVASENKLKNPGVLTIGKRLVLPKIEKAEVKTVEKVQPEKGSHLVVQGDSLWKIAVANYGDGYKWTTIWNSNKKIIRDPNKLEIGMKLLLE
jgi:nucleoid-associated protein YgaU